MQRFPRWLSWVVVIGLAYIIYTGNQTPHGTPPAPPPTTATPSEPVAQKTYPELHVLVDGERWKKAINPDYKSPADACTGAKPAEGIVSDYAIIETEGSGDGAACGDSIGITLARYGNDGKLGKANDLSLTLGEQKALDALLVGMRVGEQRLLLIRLPEHEKTLPSLPPKNQLVLRVTRNS